MSISIEKTAKTVEEAIDNALSELNVSMDETDVEILEMGSKGIFGLGGKEAKVRVTLKEEKNAASDGIGRVAAAGAEKTSVAAGQYGEVETIALDFLQGIFDYLKVVPSVQVEKKEDAYWIILSGSNLGVIIGRRGETLDSLQYLTNLVVNRKVAEKQRIIIDVEGYREAREETLKELAAKMANKALKMNGPLRLEPMNPHERRIIHMTLQGDERVETYSEGEEPFRRVVIKKSRRKEREAK